MESDPVDKLLEDWHRERPDLDPTPLAVVSRLLMLYKHLEQRTDLALSVHGMTLWQFDVLATLRRSGAPYTLSPTQLLRAMTLSSGAMTNRIDRLEDLGFVERLPDPEDRRGVLIRLTDAGRDVADQAVGTRLADAARVIAHLTPDERETLATLLRRLLAPLSRENGHGRRRPERSSTTSR